MGGLRPSAPPPGTASLNPHSGKRNAELRTISRCCLRSPWTRYRTLQSGKPNSVPMSLKNEKQNILQAASSYPMEKERLLVHGHGGILCRQPDALHPGKQKMGEGESACFLSRHFLCFHCARGKLVSFPHASCGNNKHRSFSPLRKQESRG